MDERDIKPLWGQMGLLFKAHSWHGVFVGDQVSAVEQAQPRQADAGAALAR